MDVFYGWPQTSAALDSPQNAVITCMCNAVGENLNWVLVANGVRVGRGGQVVASCSFIARTCKQANSIQEFFAHYMGKNEIVLCIRIYVFYVFVNICAT